MCDYTQETFDYILSYETENCQIFIEEKVDYSNIVPKGFGTSDCGILQYDERVLHIFDHKYGKGVLVNAFKNSQLQIYGLGFFNELMFLGAFDKIVIHICQPRLNHFVVDYF